MQIPYGNFQNIDIQKLAIYNTVGAIHELPLILLVKNYYVKLFWYRPENQKDYQ